MHNQIVWGIGTTIDNDNHCVRDMMAMHTIHDESMSIHMSI
jgi:hypothetical protein